MAMPSDEKNCRPAADRRQPKCPVIESDHARTRVLRRPVDPAIRDLVGPAADHRLGCMFVPRQYGGVVRLPDMSLVTLVERALCRHREQHDKEQNGMIYADVRDYRADANTFRVWGLCYDIDGWLPLEEVLDRVDRLGACGVSWTTYNHGRRKTLLSTGDVGEWRLKKRICSIEPFTDPEARQFLDEHAGGKKAYLSNVHVLHGGEAVRRTVRGQERYFYEIEHDPESKTRSLLVPSEPIDLSEVGQDGYGAIYRAIGDQVFGRAANGQPHYDPSCKNPSRIFWNPAHPPGATGNRVVMHDDPLFDWRPTWESIRREIEQRREAARLRAAERLNAPPPDLAEIAHYLRFVSSSAERAKWFGVICAIHRETQGSEAGRELAHSWSAGAPDLYDPDDLDDNIWDQLDLDREGGATIGTIVHLAKQHPDFARFRRNLKPRTPQPSSDEILAILEQAIRASAQKE